jgi:sugar fermentation stimulation protein A
MNYLNIIENGIFIKRINRFIAEVEINGNIEKVHVKNTGRCKELFIAGRKVYLQRSDNPLRKTKYSIISIYKEDKLINIDSQVPNTVVYESLLDGLVDEFTDIYKLSREKTYKNSRFDLYYKRENGREGFIEVKGVTLEDNGRTMFPDAPTVRGTKHIYEMIDAVKNGYEGNIFFLIQMEEAKEFKANEETDKNFANALAEAKSKGVKILVYTSIVTKDSIVINKRVCF